MKRSRAVHPQQLSLFDTLPAIPEAESSLVEQAQDLHAPTPEARKTNTRPAPRAAGRCHTRRVGNRPPVQTIRERSRDPPWPTCRVPGRG